MLLRPLLLIHLLQILHPIASSPAPSPFNSSFSLYNYIILPLLPPPAPPAPPSPLPLLQDILRTIALIEEWDMNDIKVLDTSKVKFGKFNTYEFHVAIGKGDLGFIFEDDVVWKKFSKGGAGKFEHLVNELSKTIPAIDALKMDGPFELWVNATDEINLKLPYNVSYSGLKRVLVGEGITVEVAGAQEVSLALSINGSLGMRKHSNHLQRVLGSSCRPLVPIHVLGSLSLIAYRARDPTSYIESTFVSKGMLELLPEKCYSLPIKSQFCPIDSLSWKISSVEKLLRRFVGDRIRQNGMLGLLKAKLESSNVIRFNLEIERRIQGNDSQITLAEWRTKQTVERLCFDVVATFDSDMLKPLSIKRLRPFVATDSVTWSTLTSNISFTKLRPFLSIPRL